MPKVLLYITAKTMWTFLFYGLDINENRAHVHIGKRGANPCKIWLEPTISVAENGSLTPAQIKQVLAITTECYDILIKQWQIFKTHNTPKLITIKK